MIAAAPRSRRPSASRSATRIAADRSALRARREAFFARDIDYVPCRAFLKADAERLASVPPADAAVPLDRSNVEPPRGEGLTPYLASLYRTRLLTKDEEQFYFRRMNWLKFRAAADRGRLDRRRATARQMDRIEGLLAEADTVKAILVTSNLRLVVSIAKKFTAPGWSFEDLVSEGNVALMRAVEKFNFALGNRFSTYATYAVQRHFFRLSQRGRAFRARFTSDDTALASRAAPPAADPQPTAEQISGLKSLFAGFLDALEPRERRIVVARFGFDGEPPRTFRELGARLGVCKERIRQIQGRAMEKLKALAAEARLEQMVDDWL